MPLGRSLAAAAVIFSIVNIFGQSGVCAEDLTRWPAMEAVWVETPEQELSTQDLIVTLGGERTHAVSAHVPIVCQVQTDNPFEAVHTRLRVSDRNGALVSEASITLDLFPGPNTCQFTADLSPLPLGDYEAELLIDYTTEEEAVHYSFLLRKVSQEEMRQRLNSLAESIAALGKNLEEAGGAYPYRQIQYRVAEHFIQEAETAGQQGEWKRVDALLHYFEQTRARLRAGLTFGSLAPEHTLARPAADMRNLRLSNGGFQDSGAPVFLAGARVPEGTAAPAGFYSSLGFNLLAPVVSGRTLPDSEQAVVRPAHLRQAIEAAEESGMAVVVQLDPLAIPPWAESLWPDIREHGEAELAHPGMRWIVGALMDGVLPMVAGNPWVKGLSFLEEPQFRFDSEETRQRFVARIRAQYPDRQGLNHFWRAHLGSFDDITIWGEEEETSYLSKRMYQYDWQNFHRELMQEYLAAAKRAAETAAPALPLAITFGNEAFDTGETRYAPSRESAANLMDFAACRGSLSMDHPAYALAYPGDLAQYQLYRSLAPGKPLLDMGLELSWPEETPPERAGAFVHTAVWEAAMAGLNGAVLPHDSPVFAHPETLEAFASAAADINRLAYVVDAFHGARTEVAVLYSESSKILDDGKWHLESAYQAYEGTSFSGYHTRFVSESQVILGAVDEADALVIPQTPALRNPTFQVLSRYIEGDGMVVRVGTPIPYDERGNSRAGVLRNTANTVLVRGMSLPTEFLHAMDATIARGALPGISRPVNEHGYPLEAVRTRYVEHEGVPYLYLVNLRKEPVSVSLSGRYQHGRDLLRGRQVQFPLLAAPLDPMVIRLTQPNTEVSLTAQLNTAP